MKKLSVLFLLTLFCIYNAKSQDNPEQLFMKTGEIYFKFDVESKKDIPELTMIISIDNVAGTTVYAYANEKEFTAFLDLGLDYTLLPHPNEGFDPTMATFEQIQNADALNYYPTYDAYVAMMYQFETDYPGLCDVFSIGQTVNGRELLVAKISDNVNTDEAEPEFLYTSSMHGDELTGYPLMLNLIDSLLSQYGSVARITSLVNSIEIYINPLANPDGTYAGGNSTVSGATRYNANDVDLNRNYPDPDDGPHPDGNAWQVETVNFMNFAENRHFVMSANFHGGAEVCNYPWDTWSHLSADDNWWQYVCREYADTAQMYSPSGYLTDLNNGITNGYAWYPVAGGRQDYMNYYHQCREVTIELSGTKLIPASQLEAHWEYNRRSLLNYMEQCLFGIRGIVTDANTGQPMEAEVFILNHEADSSWVYSSMPAGNYHRPVNAGTYDVRFSAPCYITQVFQNVVVQNENTIVINVQMQPSVADFTANKTDIPVGGSVDFTDISCSDPTSWQWTFEGGSPASSALQNPSNIVYNAAGSYYVKLVISDGSSSDSVTKAGYITVNEEYLMTNGSFTTCNGNFYDSGGPTGNYSDNEDYEMTFFPSAANGKIKVEFTQFSVEYQSSCSYDWLRIYDGPDISSPETGKFCGTNSPGLIISTHATGALTFVFHSDGSITASGWEAAISCEADFTELDIRVLLEGPFNGAGLDTGLNESGIIPPDQPYNNPPWNYQGTESVTSIPNPDVVDWVLVELRDATTASLATGATAIARQAAFLLSDGSVAGLDGMSALQFDISINQNLFAVVWHRNHLGIMSAFPLTETGGIYTYDFSSGNGQAFGTDAQKNLGNGQYGMIAGDANADGMINDNDGTESWYFETGQSGYLGSDVNLNGQSNNLDKNDYWYINYGKINQVPE